MKCSICKEDGVDEQYQLRGTGFEPPYQVTFIQTCKNKHKFGKVREVTEDEWHYGLEFKVRKYHNEIKNTPRPDGGTLKDSK